MATTNRTTRIAEALSLLSELGMPAAQRNERSALCLLALLDLRPSRAWSDAGNPLMGITPIMGWVREHYGKEYAPNTRETFRRQTMHQFIEGGIALYNPDKPDRPVNSPAAVYQIEPTCLELAKTFGDQGYKPKLTAYNAGRITLAEKYAMHREMKMIPVRTQDGKSLNLSPGAHSGLIRDVCTEFGPRFVPGGELVYAGDTGEKWGYFNEPRLRALGVTVDNHGKMPDVVLYYPEKNWLILAEAVTSHGPVDAKRHHELRTLFRTSKAGLVLVSAFPDRKTFTKYLEAISWETEVWIADNPSHLIHFNGAKFLGPYHA